MTRRGLTWTLIALEVLFILCTFSIVVYQAMGWHDFGFGLFSYRFYNILLSDLLALYLVYGLIREHRHIVAAVAFFSLFHVLEGAPAGCSWASEEWPAPSASPASRRPWSAWMA